MLGAAPSPLPWPWRGRPRAAPARVVAAPRRACPRRSGMPALAVPRGRRSRAGRFLPGAPPDGCRVVAAWASCVGGRCGGLRPHPLSCRPWLRVPGPSAGHLRMSNAVSSSVRRGRLPGPRGAPGDSRVTHCCGPRRRVVKVKVKCVGLRSTPWAWSVGGSRAPLAPWPSRPSPIVCSVTAPNNSAAVCGARNHRVWPRQFL